MSCTYCVQIGHNIKQCDTKHKAATLAQEQANLVVAHETVKMLLVGDICLTGNKHNVWYLNSRASL